MVEPFFDDLKAPADPAVTQGQLLSVETSWSLTVEIVWLFDKWEVLAQPECGGTGSLGKFMYRTVGTSVLPPVGSSLAL